jgi:hypothetical protein
MPKHSVIKSRKADEEAQQEQQEHPSSQMPNGQQPAKKMTTNIQGQKKQYNYLKTVKSVTELEAFAFEVILKQEETCGFGSLFAYF